MKTTNKIVILVLIVATMLMIGCNNGSKNAQIVTPVTEVPTAEVTGEVTQELTPSLEPSQETTPSITEAVTPSAESATKGGINRLVFEGDRFELGNSVNSIFQAGMEFANKEYYFEAQYSGLYDVKKQEYLTDYVVFNLNYFDGILYYTVDDNMNLSESRRSSRIEKYDLSTGEITTLYSHPSKIGQMYCINNEFFLFLSRNKLYKKTIGDNSDAEEIVFSNSQIKGVPIFGLVPTKDGVILIGNKACDYSLFADGVLFKEHVTIVYEEKNYLVLGFDGDDFKLDTGKLFERLDKWLEDGNAKFDDNNKEFEIVGLLEVCDLYPETTMSELFPDSPLWTQENSDGSTDESVTPTPVPYEGFVIGKDVNNNELKMTPEEADEFVMAGNILKLYDGSWFDIDDDGESEYVSIQPYGHWTSEIHDKGEYIIDCNGTPERREVPIQTDQVFKIQFTGYDWIPLDVDYSRQEKDIPCKDDIFVCVTSLDGLTKQIITLGTINYWDWYESDFYVFRSNRKSLIPCGWLRCNLTDFQLNAEKRFKGYEWIEDSSIGDTILVEASNWFDGEGIRVSLSDIDMETINNPLIVKNNEIRIKSISEDDVYFSAYSGEELYLYKVEMNKEALEAYCYARNLTDYNMEFKYYGGFRGIHLHNQDVDTVFKLFLEKKSTGEKGWLYQKNGIPVSADEKESYPACFGYYGAN